MFVSKELKIYFLFAFLFVSTNQINNINKLITIVNELEYSENFDYFVVYCNRQEFHDVSITNLIFGLTIDLAKPVILLTEEFRGHLSQRFTKNSLSVLVYLDESGNDMTVVIAALRNTLASGKIIVVLPFPEAEEESLVGFFKWCWRKNIVNIVVFASGEENDYTLYAYEPFPNITVKTISAELTQEFFPDHMKDFKGYTFRSTIEQAPPLSFSYINKEGIKLTSGLGVIIFFQFIAKHNATFQKLSDELAIKYPDYSVGALVGLGIIDIPIIPFGLIEMYEGASFPVGDATWCIYVPTSSEIPLSRYLLRPFQIEVWIAILAFTLTATTISSLLALRRNRKVLLTKFFIDINIRLLYIAPNKLNKKYTWLHKVFCILALFLGFGLSNLYLGTLTSYLTTSIYEPEIDTVQDFIRRKMKILTVNYNAEYMQNITYFPDEFKNLFVSVERKVWSKNIYSLNTSFGYPLTEIEAKFYLEEQKNLKRPVLRKTKVCSDLIHLTYLMKIDSPFLEPLNRFLLDVEEVGIKNCWEEALFGLGIKAGYAHTFRDTTGLPHEPLNFDNLKFVFVIYIVGMFSAFCCVLFEYLRSLIKFKEKRCSYME